MNNAAFNNYDNWKTDNGETDEEQGLDLEIDRLMCEIEADLTSKGKWESDDGKHDIDLCDVVARIAESGPSAGKAEMNKRLTWLFRQNLTGSPSKILTDQCIEHLAEHGAHDEINRSESNAK